MCYFKIFIFEEEGAMVSRQYLGSFQQEFRSTGGICGVLRMQALLWDSE